MFDLPSTLLGFASGSVEIVDILLGGIIIFGAYKGFKRGFLLEIISSSVFIIGVLLVFWGISILFTSTEGTDFETPRSLVFFLFIVFYIVGTIGLNIMGRKLQKIIDYSVLDDLDNVAALAVGGFKYALSLAIIIGLLRSVHIDLPKENYENSIVYPKLIALNEKAVVVASQLSDNFKDQVEQLSEHLNDKELMEQYEKYKKQGEELKKNADQLKELKDLIDQQQ
ncbi:CvpA family protein [Algivirga pacifica]|uniref:CvpA family protein n=1 Tax=Algivirga pacifica TaxID=1162670 RepID=A0ABP9D8X2_9BACT